LFVIYSLATGMDILFSVQCRLKHFYNCLPLKTEIHCKFATSLCVVVGHHGPRRTILSAIQSGVAREVFRQTPKQDQLEMWANAQRDGRPAEYRWRPLFNAAKFGWRPLLDAVQ